MKNLKIIVAAACIVAAFFIYLFIPNRISLKGDYYVAKESNGVTRAMLSIQYWDKWMPYKKIEGHTFIFDKGSLEVLASFVSSARTNYLLDGVYAHVNFLAVSAGKDSTLIRYDAEVYNAYFSPIKRIQNYQTAQKINTQLQIILNAAGKSFSTHKGIYGFDIKETQAKDSLLITTEKVFADTPSTAQVYDLIHQLEIHIKTNKGNIQGDPMVNMTKTADNKINTVVAFPIAQTISETALIRIKKIAFRNVLTAAVNGNQMKSNWALEAMLLYQNDKSMNATFMPFVVYNNNRLVEKDPNKWVSSIYYPIQ